jgi:outer membrane protein assembly factor BamD
MKPILPLPLRALPALLAMLAIVVIAGVSAGCKSGAVKDDPILRLGAEESLATGKDLLAQQKYARARPYLTHAFEVEPNSALGREALLLAADTYFLEGGHNNFIQAEAKYRDYINRFPTSGQAAYVQFQIANSLARRMERPDRDQATTRKALEAYEELTRLYPTSEYTAQAQEEVKKVKDNLAEHEFQVGRFYLRYGAPGSAMQRFEYLVKNFPDYREMDKALFNLGMAYRDMRRRDEAMKTFERLRQEHPDSPYIRDIPDLPETPAQKAGV